MYNFNIIIIIIHSIAHAEKNLELETRNYIINADSIEEIQVNNLSPGETTSVHYDYPVRSITHKRNKTTLLNSEYSEVIANEITAIAENTTTITTEQQHHYTVSESHQEKLPYSQYSLVGPDTSTIVSGNQFHLQTSSSQSGNVNKELTNVSDDKDNSTQPSSDTSVQHDYENVIQTCIVNENTLIKSEYSLLMPHSSTVPETAFESLYEANNHVHTYDTPCNDDAVVPPENSD